MLGALVGEDAGGLFVDALNGVEFPVFDFEHQQAAAGMDNDKIRVFGLLADGNVIPA